jgi:hypothetical protein
VQSQPIGQQFGSVEATFGPPANHGDRAEEVGRASVGGAAQWIATSGVAPFVPEHCQQLFLS